MKILKLRFKNLNSLYGEWHIDFTTPEYAADGIFALTGPTGAGKSTILDAICLALYGATPRLGKITSASNEIMSRQTGECYAEVSFEAQSGRFRCHWSQHRARKKADGKLAESKHEIADARSGVVLESKKREVARVVEEKTGMDFDRFTRSILLAQGGFDTFLKANIEEKSKILEQMTGTEIYTEISRRVHERQREEHETLNLLQAETAGIPLLTEEQETEIAREVAEKQKKETGIAGELAETTRAIAWITGIKRLRGELAELLSEEEKLAAETLAFKPELDRLARARKAAEIETPYAQLRTARKLQANDRKILEDEEQQLTETKALADHREILLNKAEEQTKTEKKEQQKQAPKIQQTRNLDLQIAEKEKLLQAGKTEHRQCLEKITQTQSRLRKIKAEKTEKAEKSKETLAYLQTNARDELLFTQLAGIEGELNLLQAIRQEKNGKKITLAKAEKELAAATTTLETHTRKLALHRLEQKKAQQQLAREREKLGTLLEGQLLREYRTRKDTLQRELLFLNKIADLEAERKKLEDNTPCPLCGSKNHPFAEGNVPEANETEKEIAALTQRIHLGEKQELQIKKIETDQNEIAQKKAATEKLEARASEQKKHAEKSLKDTTGEIAKNKERLREQTRRTLDKLRPLGIDEIPESDLTSLLSLLKKRLDNWQQAQRQREELEKQNAQFNAERERLEAILATQKQSLAEKEQILGGYREEYGNLSRERRELFGDRKTSVEEDRLAKAIAAAEENERKIRGERDKSKEQLVSQQSKIASLKQQISQRTSEIKTLEAEFSGALSDSDFDDEPSFLASRLPPEKRKQLADREKQLSHRQTDLQARKQDRESRLAQEEEKKLSSANIEDLEPARNEQEEILKQLREEIAGLRNRLETNRDAKEKIKQKQAAIESQKKECLRWERLHGLIGSADGKKYRNFAQGLTFELMVAHANRQLEKMTDRYLLIRDREEPLELNVIDNYQAGEIRSTKNLSGGESFLVSLALALGLSQMASRKVKVDSLFLDEGFGTLDEESLDTALETLAGLHQDGKLIGIISHVSALKERISTQVSVQTTAGGKSVITGPGCGRGAGK